MKKKLLFITRGDGSFAEGFSYVIELARSMNSGVSILFVYKKKTIGSYEDIMAAAAFAQAGEFRSAKELLKEQEKETEELAQQQFIELRNICGEYQADLTYRSYIGDPLPAIKDFLKNNSGIDMVLISNNFSFRKKGRELMKLIKNITKPIVSISAPMQPDAQG